MRLTKSIILFSFAIFLLMASCKTTTISTKKEILTTEKKAPKADPPFYISKSQKNNFIYVGIPNLIKVHTLSGNTKHLVFSLSNGKLEPVDVTKGLYNYMTNRIGLVSEIVVKDTVSGKIASVIYDVLEPPVPTVALGVYPRLGKNKITSETIKLQNGLVAEQQANLSMRCGIISYKMIKINKNGKRKEVLNENAKGRFNDEIFALINNAQKGDIYIFTAIKSNCTSREIPDIVYLLKE